MHFADLLTTTAVTRILDLGEALAGDQSTHGDEEDQAPSADQDQDIEASINRKILGALADPSWPHGSSAARPKPRRTRQ